MAESGGGDKDRGLWRRWRAIEQVDIPAPDALTLAAYAEGRLTEVEAEPVEAWLAVYPAALAEIIAARAASQHAYLPTERMIAGACALVPDTAASDPSDNVVPLRRSIPPWRNALAWSSIAASLIAASFIGFAMGSDAYQHLAPTQTVDNSFAETFEASPALDSLLSDDSGT